MNRGSICEKLISGVLPGREEMQFLLDSDDVYEMLAEKACEARDRIYGRNVFIRGLVEISSFCRNDCLYCGLRRSNTKACRYRLGKDEILECCRRGYSLGFRTFVLQGGEDPHFTDEVLTDIVSSVKRNFPDCALTLSLGERSRESYAALKSAGADRYLLRHETADSVHYSKLHPQSMDLESRMRCLGYLKELGYQTGCGFMVGSPFQTYDSIYSDLEYIRNLRPEMVGIGPFIPHSDTPFADMAAGSIKLTLKLLTVIRLLIPDVLLPATTALATLSETGMYDGLAAGANVIMPNLTPEKERKKYMIYNGKKHSGYEAAEFIEKTVLDLGQKGYRITADRGDCKRETEKCIM